MVNISLWTNKPPIKKNNSHPEIWWDFSINPILIKERDLKKIHLRMNAPISTLESINKDKINIETYIAIEFINQEINKIISDPNNRYKLNKYNYSNISIQKATNIILKQLKVSKNIWEILLYHKVALAETKNRNYNLKKDSLTDPLTKLYNRRLVDSKLDELINEFERTWQFFSIFIIDIDFFKNINDTFWHDMWDEVLKWISDILKKNLRTSDIASRWWGEEFLVILKWTNHEVALQKAESIRKEIEKELIHSIMNNTNLDKFCLNKKWCKSIDKCQQNNLMCFPRQITCSIWVSTIKKNAWKSESKNCLIKRADSALYIAKRNWRNMVYSWKWLEIPKKED